MISTVAASAVSTITSATAATSAVAGSSVAAGSTAGSTVAAITTTLGFSIAALSVITVVLLVLCCCGKELSAANNNKVFKVFARRLDIGIVPLTIVFTLIVVTEALKVLL